MSQDMCKQAMSSWIPRVVQLGIECDVGHERYGMRGKACEIWHARQVMCGRTCEAGHEELGVVSVWGVVQFSCQENGPGSNRPFLGRGGRGQLTYQSSWCKTNPTPCFQSETRSSDTSCSVEDYIYKDGILVICVGALVPVKGGYRMALGLG